MVRFLYNDHHSLERKIISLFVKPTILQKVNSGSALFKLDLTNRENILLCNKVNNGYGATKVISNKICTDTLQHQGKSASTMRNKLLFFPQLLIKYLNGALLNIVLLDMQAVCYL